MDGVDLMEDLERAQVEQAATYSLTSLDMEGQKKRRRRRWSVLATPPRQAMREAWAQVIASDLRERGTYRVPSGGSGWSVSSPCA